MNSSYLFKNAHVIDPLTKTDEITSVLVENGNIKKIAKKISTEKNTRVIDCNGIILAPGFCDMHTHLREPGYEHKETIETGLTSAANGGFTAVACMPNTNPAVDSAATVEYIKSQARKSVPAVEVFPIAAATKSREGKELSPIAELAEAGAVALSDDGSPVENADLVRRILEYGSMYNLPFIQHCEDKSLAGKGVINEGFISTTLGMSAIPRLAETTMLQRDVQIVEYVKGKYHAAHLSVKESIEIMRQAKKKKLNVSCEVTPHHFSLTDEEVRSFNTNTKMNPPLRTQDDVDELLVGLHDGTIDVIASDHAPHSIDEKDVEYIYAPFGIVGFETTIGLCVTKLIETKTLTWKQLIDKLSVNPRKILSLHEIKIEVGEKANFTLIDAKKEWTVDVQQFKSKSKNSPFDKWKLKGKAMGIYNNGMYIESK
ncbi:MAG: dihydroorotase [Ignavibacteria bacterium]|nr:dihydroorotase [Ignavibacteria bacterium]